MAEGERSSRTHIADSLALALLSLAVAAPGIGSPALLVFDEVFYVSDAVAHLQDGVGAGFQAHPPLGTWLIAAGIAVAGATPAGWRLAPLVAGVAAVVLLHRLALRVLPAGRLRRPLAAAGALLLTLDGSWFVLSRTAMLDGLLTAAVVGTVLAAVRAADEPPGRRLRWLAVVGVAGGVATAIKWSGALGLVAALLLLAVLPGRAVTGWRRGRTGISEAVLIGLLALGTYAGTWIPFALERGEVPFGSCQPVAAPCVERGGVRGVVDQHRLLFRYHTSFEAPGGYASEPALWPLSVRPVTLFHPDCDAIPRAPVGDPNDLGEGCTTQPRSGRDALTYLGNPAVWLTFVILLPVLSAATRRRERAAVVVLLTWGLLWVPWLVVTRSSYLFYMAPAVPFAALGVVVGAAALPRTALPRTMLGAAAGGAAGLLLTPLLGSPAAGLLGWAAGGAANTPPRDRPPPATSGTDRLTLGLVAVLAVAAAGTFVAMLSSWTAAGP